VSSTRPEPRDFERRYVEALDAHLERRDEETLSAAYELGRRALASDLGVLDMAAAHRAALARIVATRADPATIDAAEDFFRELLSSFEMTFRGYGEANAELQRMNAALLREREAALAANRELETFSYSVSHDLRAPLRAIGGFSRILEEDAAERLDAEDRKTLARVQEGVQKMGQLIEDLLGLSRVARAELARARVDVTSIAREVVERLRGVEPERRVDVVIEDALVAEADSGLVRALLENLLGNAWKFTSKKASARIELGRSAEPGRVVYFVRDDGAGFDMTYAKRLFAPFQRLHSSNDFEGTGIGLATAQRIVRRHGGKIWAEGTPGAGATFFFTLGEEHAA
jgi:light-regulated signal transduction histidine kinase (bacteriophytochrome)